MKHAPVHTTGEPVSPEAAREFVGLDAVLTIGGVPLMIGAELADRVIKRYGRLPANCEVYVVDSLPASDMPTVGDALEKVVMSGYLLGKSMRMQELISGLLSIESRAVEDLPDYALPAIAAQHIKPMRQRPAAQWKRERNGRR